MRCKLLGAALGGGLVFSLPLAAEPYQLGRPPSPEEIAGWNIDVRADGQGLPTAKGSVKEGEKLYGELCAGCHGPRGEGASMDRLAGGLGSLASERPVRTVGSFWPYATTLFDYVRRAMPFNAPQSLSADQVYAVTAFVLYLNQVVDADAVLDEKNLATVRMPNRHGFSVPDPRPDVRNEACVDDCPVR
jgi:S-disulfanyl-L-cysteine oxidoreductase SoxD